MEAAACEIERLPEELLTAIITLTSPLDAFRAAAVSRTFRAAADSDAIWFIFLPRDLPQFAEGEFPDTPPSKKEFFSDQPALLRCKLMSMRLDAVTGAKCYTLSARALHIKSVDIPGTGFSEAAKLHGIGWLEIKGKIHSIMLSHSLTYVVHMVFKLAADGFNALDLPFQMASVSFERSESTRQVCLQGYMEVGDDGVSRKHVFKSTSVRSRPIYLKDDIMLPRKRVDGWMEVELGEFYTEEGYDGLVSFSLVDTKGGVRKDGLVVWGIEIRAKQ